MEEPFRDAPADTRLIETMLWQPGQGVALAARHRARMQASAARLGFDFDAGAFDTALAAAAGPEPLRLRLTLGGEGRLEMTSHPAPPAAGTWQVAIAPQRLDSRDPWLGVKSTNRALYDRARAKLPPGIDEALFLNEDGHVCEGTITNLLALCDRVWLTPPLSDGVLPGVMRAELLAQGGLREASLTRDDLRRATRLQTCNALRGRVEAILVNWPG